MGVPCNIGDMVWGLRKCRGYRVPGQGVVTEMYYNKKMELIIKVKYVCKGQWGKDVFVSLADAKAALREEGEQCPKMR